MKHLLQPPDGPVRLVIDTDAGNEIDDQFALSWALLSPDRLNDATLERLACVPTLERGNERTTIAHHQQNLNGIR